MRVLLCVTANHRNADFDLLDRLSIGASDAAAAMVQQSPFIDGAVVLATCNRFEAYLDVDDPLTAGPTLASEATIEAMSAATGVDADELRAAVTVLEGEAVARHLFAVSSGLESVVLGEDEISGQVRRALATARDTGTTSGPLEQLFQRATRTSRGVKAATAIGGAGRSMVRLALDLAASRIADWSDTRVLILGTGRHAATTVAALRDRGVTAVSVHSRSGRAGTFATRYGLTAAADDLRTAVADADLVIACTTELVLQPDDLPEGHRLVIDLGLPRNVDRAVGEVPGVELLDLELMRRHAPIDGLGDADAAHALVRDAASEFMATSAVEPAVVALRRHVLGILDEELERSRARGEGEETERTLRHFASVLLHGPSVRARGLALEGRADEFVAALHALYGIDVEPPSAAEARGEESAAG